MLDKPSRCNKRGPNSTLGSVDSMLIGDLHDDVFGISSG
jgi:hypothetical protein